MKTNPLVFVVIAAAIIFTVAGTGSFLAEAKDNNYDYVPVYSSELQAGVPMRVSIRLDEINRGLVDCDKNGMGNRVSPDTTHFCQSYTYFNARSIRVSVDGNVITNLYYYPDESTYATSGVQFSTPLPSVGPVCCYQVQGACSVCADQVSAGTTKHRAFIFGRNVAAQTSLDGTTLFSVVIPQNLSAGVHNVELAYYAETIKGSGDNTYTPDMGMKLNGWTYGDQNQRFNHVENFAVTIVGDGQGTLQPDGTVAPPATDNTYLYLLGAAAVLFAIYMMRKKR